MTAIPTTVQDSPIRPDNDVSVVSNFHEEIVPLRLRCIESLFAINFEQCALGGQLCDTPIVADLLNHFSSENFKRIFCVQRIASWECS